MFKVSVNSSGKFGSGKYLIDSAATTHILCDESTFIHFYKNFESNEHAIELADKSKQQGIEGRVNAKIQVQDT